MDEETNLIADKNPVNKIIDRIGMGLFQSILVVTICAVFFVEGAEVIIISVLAFEIEDDWDLSEFEQAFLTGTVLIGFGIGYFLNGLFENKLGRIQSVNYSLIMIILAGFASCFTFEIWTLSFMRMLVGLASAFSSPSVYALTIEMSPTNRRSLSIILAQIMFGLGCIYIISIALTGIHWRILLGLATAPLVPAYILFYIYLLESPLYLARKQMYKEAIDNLNRICQLNGENQLSSEEEDSVKSIEPLHALSGLEKLKRLFDEDHISLTIKLNLLMLLVVCSYYDLALVLPSIFDTDEDDETTIYLQLLLVFSVQIPFAVLLVIAIEAKGLGRKNSFIILTFIIILLILVYIFAEDSRFAIIVLVVPFTNTTFIIMLIYVPEVYETEIRATGLGMTQLFSRIFSGFGVYLILFLLDTNDVLPFITIGGFQVCAVIVAIALPYDSLNMKLDTNSKDL